jgi:hypothetical protein
MIASEVDKFVIVTKDTNHSAQSPEGLFRRANRVGGESAGVICADRRAKSLIDKDALVANDEADLHSGISLSPPRWPHPI